MITPILKMLVLVNDKITPVRDISIDFRTEGAEMKYRDTAQFKTFESMDLGYKVQIFISGKSRGEQITLFHGAVTEISMVETGGKTFRTIQCSALPFEE